MLPAKKSLVFSNRNGIVLANAEILPNEKSCPQNEIPQLNVFLGLF
jgi:hypothetical protein